MVLDLELKPALVLPSTWSTHLATTSDVTVKGSVVSFANSTEATSVNLSPDVLVFCPLIPFRRVQERFGSVRFESSIQRNIPLTRSNPENQKQLLLC